MEKFSLWLRQAGNHIRAGLYRFMSGRYGADRLNMVILCCGLAASVLSSLFAGKAVGTLFWFLSYGLMIWAIFRALSRNTFKRYQENRKFLLFFDRLKDRNNRYFDCPNCLQTVRVPRGKGKISITCPRCKERFIRKTSASALPITGGPFVMGGIRRAGGTELSIEPMPDFISYSFPKKSSILSSPAFSSSSP